MTDMLEWQYTTTAVHTMSSKLSIGKSVVRFNQAARYIKRKVNAGTRHSPKSEMAVSEVIMTKTWLTEIFGSRSESGSDPDTDPHSDAD